MPTASGGSSPRAVCLLSLPFKTHNLLNHFTGVERHVWETPSSNIFMGGSLTHLPHASIQLVKYFLLQYSIIQNNQFSFTRNDGQTNKQSKRKSGHVRTMVLLTKKLTRFVFSSFAFNPDTTTPPNPLSPSTPSVVTTKSNHKQKKKQPLLCAYPTQITLYHRLVFFSFPCHFICHLSFFSSIYDQRASGKNAVLSPISTGMSERQAVLFCPCPALV